MKASLRRIWNALWGPRISNKTAAVLFLPVCLACAALFYVLDVYVLKLDSNDGPPQLVVRAVDGGHWCTLPGTEIEVFLGDDWDEIIATEHLSIVASGDRGAITIARVEKFNPSHHAWQKLGDSFDLDALVTAARASPDGVAVQSVTLRDPVRSLSFGISTHLGITVMINGLPAEGELEAILRSAQ